MLQESAETKQAIFGTINAVMAELGAITKSKKNQQQGFNYRGVDDVMNALNPLMVKHKLFCVPEVIRHEREERTTARGTTLLYSIVTMRYTLYAEDGSNVQAVVVGEGMDSGDKATNKAMAIAYKYAMFQIFSIPTEETAPDSDRDTPEETAPKQKQPPKCERCGKAISGKQIKGKWVDSGAVAATTQKKTGKCLCYDCYESGEY